MPDLRSSPWRRGPRRSVRSSRLAVEKGPTRKVASRDPRAHVSPRLWRLLPHHAGGHPIPVHVLVDCGVFKGTSQTAILAPSRTWLRTSSRKPAATSVCW